MSQPIDEPHGSCVLCWRRDPLHPLVCDACRSWLVGLIGDVRILAEQLAAEHTAVLLDGEDYPALDWHTRDAHKGEPAQPLTRFGAPVIVRYVPAGPVPGQPTGPRSASQPGSRPPVALGALDLTLPARQGARSPHARGQLGYDDDQIGDLSVATVLETWVRDWIAVRDRGEVGPGGTVAELTRWLTARTQWACDEHPAVDEFASELAGYRSTMRGVLGLTDRPEYKQGVSCPSCHSRTLYRRNGCEWVECDSCPHMLSPAEYRQWVPEDYRKSQEPPDDALDAQDIEDTPVAA